MKTDMRVVKTKKALKDSLVKLLKEKTFEKITVSELCETASINRVTFYTHYQDKYELCVDFINDIKNDVYTTTLNNVKGDTKESKLTNFIIDLFNNLLDECNDYKDIISNFGNQENSILLYMVDRAASETLLNILNNAYFRKKLKYPPDIVCAFLLGSYHKMITHWVDTHQAMPIDELKVISSTIIRDLIKSDIFFKQ